MIVVSDTTPLNYLVLIDAVELLPKLFDQVLTPPSVMMELSRQGAPPKVRTWAATPPAWLSVVAPHVSLPAAMRLDAGERDALSLAKERNVPLVLMDERRGRKVAISEGLIPMHTLAVLEWAAIAGLVNLPAAIALLNATSIRIPPDKIAEVLTRDAARRNTPGTRTP